MKKLLIAFLMMIIPLCTNAATTTSEKKIKINYQAMAIAIDKFMGSLEPDIKLKALQKYNEVYDIAGISNKGLDQVCAAGSIDKSKCTEFKKFLVESMKFADAFGDKSKFNKGWSGFQFSATKYSFPTDMATGILRFKFHGDTKRKKVDNESWGAKEIGEQGTIKLICNGTPYNNNKILCNAPLHNLHLTAHYKSATHGTGASNKASLSNIAANSLGIKVGTSDVELNIEALDLICAVVGGEFKKPSTGSWNLNPFDDAYYQTCQKIDPNSCTGLNTMMKLYFSNLTASRKTISNQTYCKFNYDNAISTKQVKSCFGLNSYVFADATIQASGQIYDFIRQYANQTLNGDLGMFDCKASTQRVGDGRDVDGTILCNLSKASDMNNVCSMNFVFASTKENSRQWRNAGLQTLSCNVIGGRTTTNGCIGVQQDKCNKIKAISAEECPLCKSVVWDQQNKLCILPDQAIASAQERDIKNMEEKVEATINIAMAVATAVTTPNPLTISGAVLVVAGEAKAMDARNKMAEFFDKYERDVTNCIQNGNIPQCAKELLGAGKLNEALSYSGEYTGNEIRSLNNQVASLIEAIPDNDEFWGWYLNDSGLIECDSTGKCALKPNAGELYKKMKTGEAMAFGGAIMQLFGVLLHSQLTKIANALEKKITAFKNVNGPTAPIASNDAVNSLDDVAELLVVDHKTAGLRLRNVSESKLASKAFMQNMINNNAPLRATAQTYIGAEKSKIPSMTKQIIDTYNLRVGSKIWVEIENGIIHLSKPAVLAANTVQALNGFAIFTVVNEGAEYFLDETPAEIVFENPTIQAPVAPVPAPEPEPEPAPVVPEPTPVVPVPTPEPLPVPTPVVPEPAPAPSPDPVVINPVVVTPVVTTPVVTTPEPEKDVTPFVPEKKDHTKTALIAGAAVLGAVGTGVLVGTLVSGNDKKDDANARANVTSDLDNKLNVLLMNAGAVGFIGANNDEVRIVPLPTTVNSNAPIVGISGKPVVVVEYRNHKFPFYVNASTMSWAPLLGIGENGGWFNVYPPKQGGGSGIDFIDDITQWLNQKLNPTDVMQFAGQNQSGVQYPAPSTSAYKIINAEFPNGVIQTNNGTLTPAQNAIYNSNYSIIKSMFKFAQKWAIFFGTNGGYTLPSIG
ncbi:MAG: hypothetical protein J6K82_00355 [Alphaproteobacteria bacterium]|nr:hypothetical protein [Alphaproteobacteria bacterium]